MTGLNERKTLEQGKICARYGDDPGFYTRCVANPPSWVTNPESYCAWLHKECLGIWPGEHRRQTEAPHSAHKPKVYTLADRKKKYSTDVREITNAPAAASDLFDRAVAGAKKSGADNPYAVAWSVVKQKYHKKGDEWVKRKDREAYARAFAAKEANAATALGQLFRGRPVSPEWLAWMRRRQQIASLGAQALEGAGHTLSECPGHCPYHLLQQAKQVSERREYFIRRRRKKTGGVSGE